MRAVTGCPRRLSHLLRRRWQQFAALILRAALLSYCVEYPGACADLLPRRRFMRCCAPEDTQ